ncbi:hypothetical protein NQ315_003897 [Exocentrus adspersus]|uniref:Uncharacterized protein n=1 Tax=Exocentrus adspersus TaxID=1586481 RepID=A0AAV8VYC0_9CUCU|nr:hypothetical protein NQ315_003897 [Exocentrus adspersus]
MFRLDINNLFHCKDIETNVVLNQYIQHPVSFKGSMLTLCIRKNLSRDIETNKSLLMIQQHNSRQNLIISSHESTASRLEYDAPPLPPRSAVVFTSMATTKQANTFGLQALLKF